MLVRWAPFNDLARVQAQIDRFFDTPAGAVGKWQPSFDVTEDASQVLLEGDLPGVSQDSIEIQVEQNLLTLKGERKLERKAEAADLYRRYERVGGAFERQFRLGPSVDTDKISATFKDGVLSIHLPKKAEAQPRQIKINVNGQS